MNRSRIMRFVPYACVIYALLAALLALSAPLQQASPRETLKHASVNGKYSMLLRQIAVPQDAATYGEFVDYGRWEGTEWAGFANLPPGYWVYLQPYWYIWRDLAADPKSNRAWGPEQATGPPNTERAGDIETAWASRKADGQPEWLMLEYAEPVVPTRIKIYETYNPGAVTRITALKADGSEVEVWKGKDTTASADGMGCSGGDPPDYSANGGPDPSALGAASTPQGASRPNRPTDPVSNSTRVRRHYHPPRQ